MWYSAKILYRSEIVSDSEADHLSEDRIILIEAANEKDAHEKALLHGKDGEHSYLNPDGEEVKWNFVKVYDVQDLCEDEIRSGMEVYSRLFQEED